MIFKLNEEPFHLKGKFEVFIFCVNDKLFSKALVHYIYKI